MLRTGEIQELTVVKEVAFGVYLAESPQDKERVLLPGKEVSPEVKTGERLDVFLYLDSKDRLIATRRTPALTVGGLALLHVKDVTKIGAFLDWGLEKDLLLPFHEQTAKVYPGQDCLVALYVDKSGRLCATMKVYPYLHHNSPYRPGDEVNGLVYELSGNFGTFVAVDNLYSGLIPKREGETGLHVGDAIRARVTGVKEDGKLDLSVRDKAYLQMDEDAEYVMQVIEEYEGVLPFDDHISPEVIRREFGLSKNAFKRAVGRLLKQGRIEIRDGKIRRAAAKPESRSAVKPESRASARPEARRESRASESAARPAGRASARPEARRESRPSARPEAKPANRVAARPKRDR